MKKTCHGCKAMQRIEGKGCFCLLKFEVDHNRYKPLEDCPKPRNMLDLSNRLERGKDNYAKRYRECNL